MQKKRRQSGMTLTELLVVIAVMAILMSISVPTAKKLMDSFDASTGVRQLINAALCNGRAIAIREQAYAGVRFQQDADGNTYMILILHDPTQTNLANGFRTVVGRKPMKLPKDVAVVSSAANTDSDYYQDHNWRNAHTFSVIFSPAGKMTCHPVRVRNMDGYPEGSGDVSNDSIFNTEAQVDAGVAAFYQDDYGSSSSQNLGLEEEDSAYGLIIYHKEDVKVNHDNLWLHYFSKQRIDHISPYTGELIIEYK